MNKRSIVTVVCVFVSGVLLYVLLPYMRTAPSATAPLSGGTTSSLSSAGVAKSSASDVSAYFRPIAAKPAATEAKSAPSVTWKSPSPKSGNGWVHVSSGGDGSYPVGFTVKFPVKEELPAATCAVLYGPRNELSCTGSCTWYSVFKPGLAKRTHRNAEDLTYVTSLQAVKDAAKLLVEQAASPSSEVFIERASADSSGGNYVDNEPVSDSQSQIACVLVK